MKTVKPKIPVTIEDGKMYAQIADLKHWEKNPRSITKANMERLKRQIKDLGEYKPLVITADGVVLGGNMRLEAYKQLGMKLAWVSVVDAKTEKRIVEYAFSDNDRAGDNDEQMIAELIAGIDELDLDMFRIDSKDTKSLRDVLAEVSPETDIDGEIPFTEELSEEHNYVVLYFDNEMDWLNLLSLYPLKTVKALDSRPGFTKKGVGRVVRGVDFINKLTGKK